MISGIAFHWYSGDHFEALDVVQKLFPGKKTAFTEGCVEYSKFTSKNQLANARMYAHDMIGDINGGAVFLINWSILFNSQGGPNHVQNWCEAPVMYDEKTDKIEKNCHFIISVISADFSHLAVCGSVFPDTQRILRHVQCKDRMEPLQ